MATLDFHALLGVFHYISLARAQERAAIPKIEELLKRYIANHS